MTATIRQIVDDATELIGQIAGPGVQQFSEDRLRNEAIRTFNLLFKKNHWEQYRKWQTVVLDGTTGIITTDAFTQVADFDDFISVHINTYSRALPILPKGMNPNIIGIGGSIPRFYTSLHVDSANYVGRKLQLYPITATGSLDVFASYYPLGSGAGEEEAIQFDWDDSFYLDRDMMVWGVAYMTLVGDDLNANAAELAKSMMETKFRDITGRLSDGKIPVNRRADVPVDGYYFQRP